MSEHAFTAGSARPRRLVGRAAEATTASPLSALAVAVACALAMAAVWAAAALIPAVHLKDAVVLYKFTTLSRPRLDSAAEFLLHLLEPGLFVLWTIALAATAVARDRPRVALAVIAVMGLAPLTADKLKPLLAHPHDTVGYVHIGAASWPSGHSTAATALALCAVLVAPARLRKAVAAVAVLFVLAVSAALLILAWHMPSDVVGGYLVAGLWMALAVAGLRAAERLRPTRTAPGVDAASPAA
ncbi:MAG: phosphatase PAP2 family protein [Solirubrobacteraceae bacterium]